MDCSTQYDGCSSASDELDALGSEQDASGSGGERAQADGLALIDAAVKGHDAQPGKASELLDGCLGEHLEQEEIL